MEAELLLVCLYVIFMEDEHMVSITSMSVKVGYLLAKIGFPIRRHRFISLPNILVRDTIIIIVPIGSRTIWCSLCWRASGIVGWPFEVHLNLCISVEATVRQKTISFGEMMI